MSIYYVRHGQTDWNKLGYLQGQSDIALNEEGIKQAKQVRDAMKQVHIDKIICSPLQRTRHTASIINENYGLEIHEDKRIIERYLEKLKVPNEKILCLKISGNGKSRYSMVWKVLMRFFTEFMTFSMILWRKQCIKIY